MFDSLDTAANASGADIASLLEAFVAPGHEGLKRRAHDRIDVRTSVRVEPGNQSDRSAWHFEATTVNVSDGGCRVIGPRAVLPGDLFALTFDERQFTIGTAIAVCQRCSMLRPGVFEIAFSFFQTIDLGPTEVAEQ